jgi:hypothetical protein
VQRVLSLTRASAKAVDKLAGSGHSETITGSKPSDAGKHDLLLRLFESQWFSPSMALHYLQNPQPGVEVRKAPCAACMHARLLITPVVGGLAGRGDMQKYM